MPGRNPCVGVPEQLGDCKKVNAMLRQGAGVGVSLIPGSELAT